MKRVLVLGCPGSGKTTFVRQLAAQVRLPVIHLDYYYHQKEHDYYNHEPDWIEKVSQLAARDKWIIDGNYGSSLDLRLKRADTVIVFDFPRSKSVYGVLKRRVQYHKKHREEMPSDWQEKINWEFLKFVWNFKKTAGYKIATALAANDDQKAIFVFRTRKQANGYLAALAS